MKNYLFTIILVVIFMAQAAHGATNEEGPLTLMKDPQTQNQNNNTQVPSQLPQLQQQGQGQEMQLYDIYGVVPTKASVPYLYIALAVLLVLLLCALLYWLYKRKGRAPRTPVIPPWERALMELEEAKQFQNMSQGIRYMDRASQILRRYIEQRFAVKTTRKTTREFLYGLGSVSSSELQNYRSELQSCLEQADMAKFAHQIQDEHNLQMMEQAVSTFVQSTRPDAAYKEGGK